MREQIKIYRQIQFFELSWCFLRLELVYLAREGIEGGVLTCQGQTEKIPASALFFTCPSRNSDTHTHFKIPFLKSTRTGLSPCKVLLQ